ncbi:hypothetical protein M9H77_05019 [Catharanthus roseus]|uniref:Uncharacterized protein n=1 Tax=Catharanthus roseus TaxID=4058 RepID=A0ACC0CFV8_CATRO|nr:hypothetical protein M9H77_05019 [Catharanthus roseus]
MSRLNCDSLSKHSNPKSHDQILTICKYFRGKQIKETQAKSYYGKEQISYRQEAVAVCCSGVASVRQRLRWSDRGASLQGEKCKKTEKIKEERNEAGTPVRPCRRRRWKKEEVSRGRERREEVASQPPILLQIQTLKSPQQTETQRQVVKQVVRKEEEERGGEKRGRKKGELASR